MTLLLTTLLLFTGSPLAAETLTGLVIDTESSLPVSGAAVQTEDARLMTTTASDGTFILDVAARGPLILRISRIGYQAQDYRVDSASTATLRIDLVPQAIAMPEMFVSADPIGPSKIHRNPAFATVITRATFEGTPKTLPELLSQTTGVQVKTLGGLGAFSTISLRGSSAEQVEVYLDGILLNSAQGGGVDLSNLPLAQVEQIEVYRGSGAEGNGVGGAVHIRTRDTGRGVSSQAGASWGSFDTRSASASVQFDTGRSSFIGIADVRSSDNDFSFLDDNGTEYNAKDDEATARINNDTVQGSLLAKWRTQLTEGQSLTVSESLFWKHQGIPGISNNQSRDVRFDVFRSLTETIHEAKMRDGRLTTRNGFFVTHAGESYTDLNGEVGVGRQDNDYRTNTFGWRSRSRILMRDRHFVTLGTTASRESFLPTAHIQSFSDLFKGRRWILSSDAALDLALPGDRGILFGSADVRQLRSTFTGINPFAFSPTAPDRNSTRNLASLRSGIRFDISAPLSLKANIGRAHRAPSLFELFGDRGGVIGNSDLLPEKGFTWDAGFRFDADQTTLEGAYFNHSYMNLIQFVHTSQATSRPTNIGRARAWGVEVTAMRRLGEILELSGSYTYQRTEDRSEIPHFQGNQLPNRAPHVVFGSLNAGLGSVNIAYEYTFEDGSFLDQANRKSLDARHIHNIRLSCKLAAGATVGLDARNIGNTQIADVWGYPLPGRTLFITVQTDFDH